MPRSVARPRAHALADSPPCIEPSGRIGTTASSSISRKFMTSNRAHWRVRPFDGRREELPPAWQDLNERALASHPLADPRFPGALLRHFGAGGVFFAYLDVARRCAGSGTRHGPSAAAFGARCDAPAVPRNHGHGRITAVMTGGRKKAAESNLITARASARWRARGTYSRDWEDR